MIVLFLFVRVYIGDNSILKDFGWVSFRRNIGDGEKFCLFLGIYFIGDSIGSLKVNLVLDFEFLELILVLFL